MSLPGPFRYPNGLPVPDERIYFAGTIVDSHAGYMVTAVADTFLEHGKPAETWEVWSVTTGRLRRYDDFATAWAHYLRVVRQAVRRDSPGLRLLRGLDTEFKS